MTAASRQWLTGPQVAAAAAIPACALALGALHAVSAFAVSPLALPAALALAVVAAVTLSRPEVGIAIAFILVPVGNAGLVEVPMGALGVQQPPAWLLPTAWVVFVFLVSLLHFAWSGPGRTRAPRLSGVAVAYLAVALIATAVASDLSSAQPVLRSLATGLLLFFSIVLAVDDRKQVAWILAGIATSALAIGAYAVYQHVGGYAGSEGFFTSSGALVSRVDAGFPHPNQLGGFLAMVLPVIVAGALMKRRGRALLLAAAGLAVIGTYLSFSRGSLLALAVVPLAFLRDKRSLVAVPLLVVMVLAAAPGLVRERFATATSSGSELSTRTDFWRTAGFVWTQQPLLGVGLGGFPDAYADARVVGKQFLPTTIFQPPPDAHNVFLQHLAEQGILGLLAFLAVVAAALKAGVDLRGRDERWSRHLGAGMVGACAVVLVGGQFSVTLLEATGTVFWGMLGLLSAASAIALGGDT